MIEHILTHYPNLKFVYASDDTNDILENLKATYPGQFFHIGEHKDLDEIMKRAKLFWGTYPIGGALIAQYAIMNKCIPRNLDQDSETRKTRPNLFSYIQRGCILCFAGKMTC